MRNRLALTVLIVAVILPSGAQARNGRIDRSFGKRGQIALTGASEAKFRVSPEGSMVIWGGFGHRRLTRYRANGHRDPNFGDRGSAVLPRRVQGSPYEIADLAIDRAGRAVVFGSVLPDYPTNLLDGSSESVSASQAMVLRLRGDGQLDPTFGHDGVVREGFGLRSEDPRLVNDSELTTRGLAGLVDSQDRPVLLAGVTENHSPCLGHSGFASYPRAIVRLTPTGRADTNFGGGDGVSPPLRNFDTFPEPILGLSATDQPEAAGGAGSGCATDTLVFRLNAAGALLTAFDNDGRRIYPGRLFGTFQTFAPSGAQIFSRGVPSVKIFRVTPLGRIDRRFGEHGYAPIPRLPGDARILRPSAVDSKGRIILTGSYALPTAESDRERAFMVVERLLRDGKPDRGFGRGGRISIRVPSAQVLGSTESMIDSRDRLYVFSRVQRPADKAHGRAVVARFLLDG
jgi:uncharacterized delta-60 repeat protein